MKGVVNAALGQEIGSVSISVKLGELHANKCDNRECETNACHCAYLSFQRDHLKIAQQFFQLVGGSASECGAPNRNLINTTFLKETPCEHVCVTFLSFQTLFLAGSAWPPASSS